MYIPQFMCLFICCFYLLAVMSSASVNTGVHVLLTAFSSFGYIPRAGTAGSYGNSG